MSKYSDSPQICIKGLGMVKHGYKKRVINAIFEDLGLDKYYCIHTQPDGIMKLCYIGDGSIKPQLFTLDTLALVHASQLINKDIFKLLLTNAETFPSVKKLAPRCFKEPLGETEIDNINATLQKRREALGIDTLPVPNEFICPITFDKMVDPVVASDGNSYERSAIAIVLERPNPLSPLTREPLDQALFVNRNLKKRILEYENDVLNIVEHAVALATERLAHDVKRQKVA